MWPISPVNRPWKVVQKRDHASAAGNFCQEAGKGEENTCELPDRELVGGRSGWAYLVTLSPCQATRGGSRQLAESSTEKMGVSSPVTHQDAESSVRNIVQVHTVVLATHLLESPSQGCSSAPGKTSPKYSSLGRQEMPFPVQPGDQNTERVLLKHTATLKEYKSQDTAPVIYCCITNHPKL